MSNLSEEEKKAIDEIDNSYDYNTGWVECEAKTWYIVTKLIERLQKENEYLREREEYLEKRRSDIINTFQNKVTGTTIPKDKIKDRIKELKEQLEHTNTMEWQSIIKKQIEVLEDLLKESDIE